MKELEYNNHTIKIIVDDEPIDPREFDCNFSSMALFNRRYNLSDKDLKLSLEEAKEIEDSSAYIKLPVYGYDHGGLTISTSPFSCKFDSGKLGIVFVSKEKVKNYFKVKKISSYLFDKVLNILKSEVETYNLYLTGQVYVYQIIQNDEIIESVGGIYAENTDEVLEYAKESVDAFNRKKWEQLELEY